MNGKDVMITMPVRMFHAMLIFCDPIVRKELIKAMKPYMTDEIKADMQMTADAIKKIFSE